MFILTSDVLEVSFATYHLLVLQMFSNYLVFDAVARDVVVVVIVCAHCTKHFTIELAPGPLKIYYV